MVPSKEGNSMVSPNSSEALEYLHSEPALYWKLAVKSTIKAE